MANRFLNNITINDEYTLPSADGTADQIITTDGAGQLSFVDQSTIASGSTEVVEVPVKNLMGSNLKKGDPVYISGSVGASGRLEVKLADASDSNKMPAVGLLKQDLVSNEEGFVVVTGKLRNLITSPIDGATPNPNDVIYVKPNGTAGAALTLTKPTGSSNLIQNMGKVGRVSTSSDGTFIVSSILRSNDVPNLTTGKIWVGDGNTTESTVVHLDETNGRMGIGTTTPGTKLDVSGSAFIGASHSTATIGATSFACGDGNTISAFSTFAAGHLTTASGDISAAFGYDTTASGAASFSTGALTTASGGNSFASGGGSTASGGESAAFGFETTASGEESFAIGNQTTASGASSFAGGGPTTLAGAPNAFAFGADVDVTGGHSAGFGRLHDIAGTENLVGGLNNVVNGAANLVGGANNDLGSKTNNLVAGGSNTFGSAAGDYNTIIGFSNECNDGSYSFIGGQDSFNFGDRSISFGSGTTASLGNQQFAFGEGTTTPTSGSAAYGSNQFVVGKFNIFSTGGRVHLFAVGNGTGPNSRTNAFNVDTLGRVGVNQYSPNYTFDVTGTGRFTGDMYLGRYIFHNGDTNTWIGFPTNDTISFRTNNSDRVRITSIGNVGIGTSTPLYLLDAAGTIRCTSLIQTSQSDKKENISDIDKSKPRAIPFKEYRYKSDIDSTGRKRYGVLVEDIEDDYPELVYVDSNGDKAVNYIDLLVKRVAELEKELEDISLTPGPKGSTGATGATGPQGPAGNDGKNGSDATIPVLGCKDDEIGTFTSIKICEGSIYFNYVDSKGVKQEPIKCQIAK